MNCLFCFTDALPLTKEHLLSKPICRLLGIERAEEQVGRFNGVTQTVTSIASLESTSVRAVCAGCNNGWMSQLEVDTAAVLGRWFDGTPLDEQGAHTLRRWMAKTHLILCLIEGRAHKLIDESTTSVLMDATLAREVREHADLCATTHTRFGAARTAGSTTIRWAFGTPSIRMAGPKKPNNTIATASIMFLGNVQLWTVNTPLPTPQADSVAPPGYAKQLAPGMTAKRLLTAARHVDPARAIVDYTPLTRDHYEQMLTLVAAVGAQNESQPT